MAYIYQIINDINDKIYIGKTATSISKRWSQHKHDYLIYDWHLYKAMRKYGLEKFSIEQIDSTDDFKELGMLEREYIKKYNSQNPNKGYNLTAGGESNQWDANPAAKLTYGETFTIALVSGSIINPSFFTSLLVSASFFSICVNTFSGKYFFPVSEITN